MKQKIPIQNEEKQLGQDQQKRPIIKSTEENHSTIR